MKTVQISLLGLGVVGSKLMEFIQKNQAVVRERYQVSLVIGPVYVRDLKKSRHVDLSGIQLTNDPYLSMEKADIVIDCLGGNNSEQTLEFVLSSIHRKKSVIMSSKKCLALHGAEIMRAVKENQVAFGYDATVGGCIPISSVLEQMGQGERIEKIYGICNATSNYILGEMKKQVSYDEAIQRAIALGLAENDPEEDVAGWDACYKAVILAAFGMGVWIDPLHVRKTPIYDLSIEDMEEAARKDSVIKPTFSILRRGETVECCVSPTSVEKSSLLACVHGTNNVIIINSSESGERAFVGQGAGADPTASAMYDDLIRMLKQAN